MVGKYPVFLLFLKIVEYFQTFFLFKVFPTYVFTHLPSSCELLYPSANHEVDLLHRCRFTTKPPWSHIFFQRAFSSVPGHTLLAIFPSFRPMGMVGEACLPSNAYYPRTPDYTLCSGVHVCWSEHSDSSFVYGFMILDYGFGTMTATTFYH